MIDHAIYDQLCPTMIDRQKKRKKNQVYPIFCPGMIDHSPEPSHKVCFLQPMIDHASCMMGYASYKN